MKICVCIKYVPVVSRITFDNETKTINREGVPSEPNPFDMLGLNRALEICHELGIPIDITALTMGPPDAENALKQALGLGATKGVLLSDRAFAGSDTLITSKILSSFLQNEKFDLIITGRNSSDSETGQVGPQIAEFLNIPHISNVNNMTIDSSFSEVKVSRTTSNGYSMFECPLPCLITVTEGVAEESWPTKEQMENAEKTGITTLGSGDLGLEPENIGASASPTWVEDIRIVENNRLGLVIENENSIESNCEQAVLHIKNILSNMNESEQSEVSNNFVRNPKSETQIWVVSESEEGKLKPVSFELLGKAREIAGKLKGQVTAVTFGESIPEHQSKLGRMGADSIINLNHLSLGPLWSDATADFFGRQISEYKPYAVLFPATSNGRDLASRIAAKLKLGLTGDAIDLELDTENQLVQIKPALGGNIVAPILSKTIPYMVTLREGMLSPIPLEEDFNPQIQEIEPVGIINSSIRFIEEFKDPGTQIGVNEDKNSLICLGVGMGVGSSENVTKIVELAHSLDAALATSRNVVHEGWLPYKFQVGISGTTIAPKIYVAIGLRGAFNHTVGIQKSGVIIGINTNKRHPIFKACDVGLVGDWEEILPVLTEKLKPIVQTLAN